MQAPEFPHIESFSLTNGLSVYVLSSTRSPLVVHTLWYRVGAADEPSGQSGLAHLLEHLMFQGTRKYPGNTFSKIVTQNGGMENAFTARDYTGYYQVVAPDRLSKMMEMESDRMRNLDFEGLSIEKEKRVVLEERFMRVESTPASRLREMAQAILFLNHPYRRPIIGWSEEIESLGREALEAFYRTWYQPANAVLFVVGHVEVQEVRDLAEKFYAPVHGVPVAFRSRPSEPARQTPREVSLQDAEVPSPHIEVSFQAPSMRLSEGNEVVALEIFSALLNRPGGRMEKRLIEAENALAVRFWADFQSSSRDIGVFRLYAVPREGVQLDDLEENMHREIQALLEEGIQPGDVEELKRAFVDSMVLARDDFPDFATFVGGMLASDVSLSTLRAWPERVLSLREEDVRKSAEKLLSSTSRVHARLLSTHAKE